MHSARPAGWRITGAPLRFLKVQALLAANAIGRPRRLRQVTDRLATGATRRPSIRRTRRQLFLDLARCLDLLDFLVGPSPKFGFALNTGRAYAAKRHSAAFRFDTRATGTGIWNFNADAKTDVMTFTGSEGTIATPVFSDGDVVLSARGGTETFAIRNPPHVHQPLIQTIVDELRGRGNCPSTGASGARASWVMDRCLEGYYG